jgi:hypothetical protein
MNQATKAALLNALLFPGWGQFYLKRYKRGLVFFIPLLTATCVLGWMIIQVGAAIIKAAPLRKGTIQFSHILQISIEAVKKMDISYMLTFLFLIIVLWILSIIDAYLLGKKTTTFPTTDAHPESISDQE